MARRPMLVHYHIFKNAGCSVDVSLKASFGDTWTTFEGAHAHDVQSSAQLAAFLLANPHLRAVSSHLARPPLPWDGCLPIVFLRHPLLRARSVYEFVRRDATQPFSSVARGGSFSDYVRWALRRERGGVVIRNYQVVHLSRASLRCEHVLDADARQDDLNESCELLSKWGMAGIVEAYALSVQMFEALYAPTLPELKLENVRINATSAASKSVEQEIEGCCDLLGPVLYEEFAAANALDFRLYEHGKRILSNAARALVPDKGSIRR